MNSIDSTRVPPRFDSRAHYHENKFSSIFLLFLFFPIVYDSRRRYTTSRRKKVTRADSQYWKRNKFNTRSHRRETVVPGHRWRKQSPRPRLYTYKFGKSIRVRVHTGILKKFFFFFFGHRYDLASD